MDRLEEVGVGIDDGQDDSFASEESHSRSQMNSLRKRVRFEDSAKSVEGWIVLASNVCEEAQEEDVYERFAKYGEVKSMYLDVSDCTGFLKRYCIIEYDTQKSASMAIENMHGQELLGQRINVNWAFVQPKLQQPSRRNQKK